MFLVLTVVGACALSAACAFRAHAANPFHIVINQKEKHPA